MIQKGTVPNDYNLHEKAFCACKMISLTERERNEIYFNILNISMIKCINDIKLLMRYKINIDIFYCMFHKYAVETYQKSNNLFLLQHKFDIDRVPLQYQTQPPQSYNCYLYCKSIDDKNYLMNYLYDDNTFISRLSMGCTFKKPLKQSSRFNPSAFNKKCYYLLSFFVERNLLNSDELQVNNLNSTNTNYVSFKWFTQDNGLLPLDLSNMSIRQTGPTFARIDFQFESISLDFLLTATVEQMVKRTKAIIDNFDKFLNMLKIDFEHFL